MELLRFIDHKYAPGNIELKNSTYSEMSLDECLNAVDSFFKRQEIDLDVRKMVEDGTVEFSNELRNAEFYNSIRSGVSFFDEYGHKKARIKLDGNILDCATMVHELMHYSNQTAKRRGFVSNLLTESISYGMELIFFEDLKGTLYEADRTLHFRLIELLLFEYAYQIYYIYKMIILYKRRHDISKESYELEFTDGEYELTLEKFEEYVQKKKRVLKDTWLILGLPLAIYFLEEYRKDMGFMSKIREFNEAINEKPVFDCLKIVNIQDKSELMERIESSSSSFLELLLSLEGSKKI